MRLTRRRFLATGGAIAAGGLLGPAWPAVDRKSWTVPADLPLAEHGVPGISIALGAPGRAPSLPVAGVTRAGGDRAVGTNTIFPCGSLSKPVLATIAIRLHLEGSFDLDRPLAELLETDLPSGPGADRITARHALQHTTGLRNWRFTLEDPFVTARPPGTAWGYSGEGIVLVQRAVEKATGHGLEALARRHVFEPFGMKRSSFIWNQELEANSAVPFVPADHRFADYAVLFRFKHRALVEWARSEGRDPSDVTLDDAREADAAVSKLAAELAGRELPATDPMPTFLGPNSAGGLSATASDYLSFLHGWLVDPKLGETAFAKPVPRPGGLRWGLGWGLEADGDPGPFWHWGEGTGYRTLAYADPDAGEAMVLLTNGNEGMAVIEEASTAITGRRSPIFDVL